MIRWHHAAIVVAACLPLATPSQAEITAPLNSGEKLIYAATGVQNDENGEDATATVFACTNLGQSGNVVVRVEVFGDNGNPVGNASTNLSPGETDFFETQNVATIAGTIITMGSFNDVGSARIIGIGPKVKIACIAFVIDPDATESTAYMHLPIFLVGKAVKVKTRSN